MFVIVGIKKYYMNVLFVNMYEWSFYGDEFMFDCD